MVRRTIKKNINDPITEDDIKKVDEINSKSDLSLCYGIEMYSVMEHSNRYYNFKKLLSAYKELFNHRKFKPNGMGYNESKDNFELLNNIYEISR